MSRVIAWRTPPKSTRGRRGDPELEQLIHELKSRPGDWAYIGIRKSSSYPSTIRRAKTGQWFRAGRFDARAVRADDGADFDIYVRYLGPREAT